MTAYKKLDDYTLQAVTDMSDPAKDWGAPRLSRIFNFRAREVITLYERGGLKDFTIPGGNGSNYYNQPGYAAAVTSAMTSRSFADFESPEELEAMHAELTRLGGKPPPLDNSGKPPRKLAPR